MLELILAAFAVFFLAQLFAVEHGLGDIFLRWRLWLKARHQGLWKLFRCSYCSSVYVAFAFALIITPPIQLRDLILNWLALTGATWVLLSIAGRENSDE